MYPYVLKLEVKLAEFLQVTGTYIHHQCQRTARLEVAVDELGQNVEANLSICNGLDNTNWQSKTKRDSNGQQERPPAEVCREPKNGVEPNEKHLHQR